MVYFLLTWTGLLAVCWGIGYGALRCLGELGETQLEHLGDRAIISAWLGLTLLATALLLVALFLPLSPLVGFSVTLLLLLLALQAKAVRTELQVMSSRLSTISVLGYGLCAGAIASFFTRPISWIDTGLYHAGLISWLAEYGVTPGLVLLNPQFGFMSAWFAIAAPFNPLSFGGRASAVMNGFALLLTLLQAAIALNRIIQKHALTSDWFLLIFSLTLGGLLSQTKLLSVVTVSPSPDIAVALLTAIFAWAILINLELVPIFLAASAVSIKLTALPLLAIAIGFYFSNQVSWRRIALVSLLSMGLLSPFFATEILVSGCPLYPSTFACSNLPWTLDVPKIEALAAATRGWGTWFGSPPAVANSTLWLLQAWFNSNASSKLITLLILISGGSLAYFLLLSRAQLNRALIWLIILGISGTTFIMFKAPLFRLGMGYVLLLPILSSAMFFNYCFNYWLSSNIYQAIIHRFDSVFKLLLIRKQALSLIGAALIGVIILGNHAHKAIGYSFWLPPPLPVATLHTAKSNGITYAIVQDRGEKCWAAKPPCVDHLPLEVYLRDRTIGIRGGFTRKDPRLPCRFFFITPRKGERKKVGKSLETRSLPSARRSSCLSR